MNPLGVLGAAGGMLASGDPAAAYSDFTQVDLVPSVFLAWLPRSNGVSYYVQVVYESGFVRIFVAAHRVKYFSYV
jgi:hypothetical protein